MNIKHAPILERAGIEGSYVSSSLSWAQLQRGTFDIAYSVLEEPLLRVAWRLYNVAFQAEAKIEPNRSVVAVLADQRTRARWFGADLGSDMIAAGRDCIDVRTDGPSAFFSVTIDQSALHREFPASPDADALTHDLPRFSIARDPIQAAHIRGVTRLLFSRPSVAQRMASGTLIPLLADALGNYGGCAVERTKCLNRRFTAVRACEAYMRDHVDATVTLLDLTTVCGMRARSLINAFEAVTGFSPMDYLKRLRLNGVRRALGRPARAHTRVIDVATAWGFWHMGHFANDYRAMFGETPSQTLLNSQRQFALG
ncbi:MAG TPA: helix-turn-helix domain-containing protein [Candidatus Cybelea sp.]|jgi:AraC family ethanolamine operon transcriptional activator